MLSLFGSFKNILQLKRCLIDNTTFRLHYKYTFAVLCTASLLTTAKQYFGDPIDCITPEGVPESVFETYCWILGTFTLPSNLVGKKGQNFVYPGVGTYPSSVNDSGLVEVNKQGEEKYHAWYQWVVFVLFFQAILCYLPHLLWKSWEGGKLSLLLQNLGENSLDIEPEKTNEKRLVIVNYFQRNLRTHNIYIYKFIFCEFLNLVNIIGQMYLMNVFFNGQFTTYGLDVLSFSVVDMDKRVDPMAKVFPKMSKCTFYKYGSSGTIQNLDGLCILPINIINEKIYIFIWFWFLILIIWTLVFFCFRIVTIVSKDSRYLIFCGRTKSSDRHVVAAIMTQFWLGDWFILMQLCKNIHPETFYQIILDLKESIAPLEDNNNGITSHTSPTLPLLKKQNMC